jgi:hypothetical protein
MVHCSIFVIEGMKIQFKSDTFTAWDYWALGFCPLSGVLRNIAFWEGAGETPTWLGPLIKANLSHFSTDPTE